MPFLRLVILTQNIQFNPLIIHKFSTKINNTVSFLWKTEQIFPLLQRKRAYLAVSLSLSICKPISRSKYF